MSELKEDLLNSCAILNCIDRQSRIITGNEISETDFDDIVGKLEEKFQQLVIDVIKEYYSKPQ